MSTQATGTDSDLDDYEERLRKVALSPSPEGGWLTWFDPSDIENLVTELRAARRLRREFHGDGYIFDWVKERHICVYCLQASTQAHSQDCPIAAYDALRHKQWQE